MTIAAMLLFLFLPAQAAVTRFSGEVSQGQNFEREFGPGLVFRLRWNTDPVTPGWTIEVLPKGEANDGVEFSWVVTPPYRGFNPRYLEISYGFSAQQILEMNLREFNFVRNRKDYEVADDAVRKLLWPPAGQSEEQWNLIRKTLESVPTCRGTLRILASRARTSIEWIKFEVELCR